LRLYRRADRDKDGELDAREFARTFDVEASNPFLERLVRLFDVSGDGKLSPFEFVVCLSQFTNSSRVHRDAHVYFAWRLFDTDDDGSMSKPEFREALRATYFRERAGDVTGDGKKSSRRVVGDGGMRRGRGLANFGGTGGLAKGLDAIMRDVDGDKDGRVTVREFSRMTRDYPHVIAPAFDLWTKLAQVGQPATRARREIEARGNFERLGGLAGKSSEERRGEIGPEPGVLRGTAPGKETEKNTNGDDAMAAFRVADPRSRRRIPGRKISETRGKRGTRENSFDDFETPVVAVSRRRERRASPTNVSPGIPKIKTKPSSWRLPSFSSPRTPPPPKTKHELEMEAACASTDEEEERGF
jgi:Ca2+-binding EF-hand superfamily protein